LNSIAAEYGHWPTATTGRTSPWRADVQQILNELERVGLLFRFYDAGTGKAWGFWTGIDKKGRLPSPSRQEKKHETVGPFPPKDALEKYVKRTASQWLANGEVGFGFGLGTGKSTLVHENRVDSAYPENRRRENVLPLLPPAPEDQAIARIWAYYLKALAKNPKVLSFTAKRNQKARARYRECLKKTEGNTAKAEELMRIAIDNLAASDYHRQNGYDSFESNLFPNSDKLEWWLDRPEKAGAAS